MYIRKDLTDLECVQPAHTRPWVDLTTTNLQQLHRQGLKVDAVCYDLSTSVLT